MTALIADGELIAEPPAGDSRMWWFTFGPGHRLVITHPVGGAPDGPGVSLDPYYVCIPGTWEEARERMIAVFGTAWCGQRESAEAAGVRENGLIPLDLPGLDGAR